MASDAPPWHNRHVASDDHPNITPPRRGLAIAQFMWAYQPHFRISVELSVENALSEIGFIGDHYVMLVGFQVAGEHTFQICIEPEDGPYNPADLADVVSQGRLRYDQHPDRRMRHSDPRTHELRHLALHDEMRAEALSDALSATAAGEEFAFFASRSTRIDDYEVHVVVGLDRDELTRVPQLQTISRDRMHVTPSLLHAVIYTIFGRAAMALNLPDAGSGQNVLGARTPEIVRSAAEEFVRSVLLCAGHWFGSEMDLIFNAVSSLQYEGRPGTGRIVVAQPDTPAVGVELKLKHPVGLRDTRAVRKLIESSGTGADLLSNGEEAYGLGSVNSDYDPTTETVFIIEMVTRGTWDLSHDGHTLMSVRDGIARLPYLPLNIQILQDAIERTLPDPNIAALTDLAQAASVHEHGAMLIMSANAAEESMRLSPQAWSIEPAPLAPRVASQLTAMDGGILVDPQGRCHAIGVILDGMASGAGRPDRGSRFNNAIRYLSSDPPPAVVVVYSADGTIDILPRLQPRIRREVVDIAVEQYLAAVAVDPPAIRPANDAWERLKALRFYLSKEQCEVVNVARAVLEAWRLKNQQIRIVEQDLSPDPDMNDSYWLP
jgi:sensor domain DACNG-containing protein/sensor domain DACNH-containing protein